MLKYCSSHKDSIKIHIELSDLKLERIQLMQVRKMVISKSNNPYQFHQEEILDKLLVLVIKTKAYDSFIAQEAMELKN